MAPRDTNDRGGWQVKRVNSATGPNVGTVMTDAIEEEKSVTDQTTLLWKGPENRCLGSKCSYVHLLTRIFNFLFYRWLEGRGPIQVPH